MKKLTSNQIRQAYLSFFAERGHTVVPSSSLIPGNDPTLLFANSGMVQFKDTFLGLEQRPYTRATTAQKCLRVSGKHNDLEEVGPSPRHHTFFEMLGNFSFGDYFKADAIPMAWDLLTKVFELPVERLWFTVFEGNGRVPADEDAAAMWIKAGADPSRILRFGEKDNFWVMADTGPCGPCSEITVYLGDDLSKMSAAGVNSDDPDYVEIWNNVFMQFERSTMQPLPRPSVDTGMGLERMAMVLQGVKNNYDTDLFVDLINRIKELRGSDEKEYRARYAPYRAVADHSRSVAFLIADGVLPGNTGRSYVLRRILRRAVYQGRTVGFDKPFFTGVVDRVVDLMGDAYPELKARRDFILETVDTEEQQFLRTLSGGLSKLGVVIEQVKQSGGAVIPGGEAFKLKDTDGFPLDLTEKIAAEQGMTVDTAGYDAAMNEQRSRSRAVAQFKKGADTEVWAELTLAPTSFVGYTDVVADGQVVAIVSADDVKHEASAGTEVQIVLNKTPFYAESGGQVGDTGWLIGPRGRVQISDTQRPIPGVTVHFGVVESGMIGRGETVRAEIDQVRRNHVMRNHTATHLLQRALRDVVGEHVAQAGSLVAPERLRFDFTHHRAVTLEQQREIEQRVNAWVRANQPVVWREMAYQEALDNGAIALFGEKYGDRVRLVHAAAATVAGDQPYTSRDSRELCGGTHVTMTGEIGQFRIIAESSVAGGVRRIEAVTGLGAEQWVESQLHLLREAAGRLSVPAPQLVERVDTLLTDYKQRQRELDALKSQATGSQVDDLIRAATVRDGVTYVVARVDNLEVPQMRELGDKIRDHLTSAVVVLASAKDERAQLLVMVSKQVTQHHAGNLVKALAPIVGGSGGGRPDMAQAGGRDITNIDAALNEARVLLHI
ncbi:MAG: alanine--tRNA ligase [Chloroflexi bacterium]|nr:alanine--tRNA ligase [Chloroflexota bacterium]